MVKRHKGDTATFDELTPAQQARSINGSIRSLEMAIENHSNQGGKPTSDKCIAQVERLVKRLKKKYP